MSQIRVDPEAVLRLADELRRLHGRLDLGQSNQLRETLNDGVTGYAPLSRGIDDYENAWDFGRDRIMTSLTKVIDYLNHVGTVYSQTEAALSGQGVEETTA